MSIKKSKQVYVASFCGWEHKDLKMVFEKKEDAERWVVKEKERLSKNSSSFEESPCIERVPMIYYSK